MTEYIKLKKSNCKNCYKCIRNCPVKSIRFSAGQAHIVEDECILCGQCFVVCPQDAKLIRNDIEKAKDLLMCNDRVIASVAPSFVANYGGFEAVRAALKSLGFYDAEETAIGATIVKTQYERLMSDKKVMISSCCHSVNVLIQKYFPEMLQYLAPVVSPMLAHSQSIKERYEDAKTVFIGPCISKKAEAETYKGIVDCVLTFEELSSWFKDKDITLPNGENVDNEQYNEHSKARLFPIAGGIIKTMDTTSATYDCIIVDGVENCIDVFNDIRDGKISSCFIEMSACKGSCIGGPVMEKGLSPVKNYLKVSHCAGKKDFEVSQPTDDKIHRHHPFIGLRRTMPGAQNIADILMQMGKTLPEHELNCGTCGYNTCRDKAIAVYQGKADLSMCLPFIKERAESFSDNIIKSTPNAIIVTNDMLEIQQINEAALRLLGLKNQSDVIGRQVVCILDVDGFLEVQNGKDIIQNKHIYLAEYDKYVEQTIVYDKDYHIFICIMRDVTDVQTQRKEREALSRQTISITDQVVEKQMRVVQEIAYLMGETVAETKVALTKLKESLAHE